MGNKIKIAVIHANDPVMPPSARPGSESYDPEATRKWIDGYVNKNLAFMEEAGKQKADLVVTHEIFTGSVKPFVEEIPGPISNRLSEVAKKYNMHVAANYYEKYEGKIYNTSVLIGRKGEIIGKYHKVHLAVREAWTCEPGDDFPVFDTDIGRIGFVTCYDISFTESCRILAMNGADIIIHQTQGWGIYCNDMGESLVRTRAAENQVYLVVAKNIQKGDGGKSCVVDNMGYIIAQSPNDEEQLVITEFEPNYDLIDETMYNNLFAGVNSSRARFALGRRPAAYKVLVDEKAPIYERYKNYKINKTVEEAKEALEKLREYNEAIKNNKPVKFRYRWG